MNNRHYHRHHPRRTLDPMLLRRDTLTIPFIIIIIVIVIVIAATISLLSICAYRPVLSSEPLGKTELAPPLHLIALVAHLSLINIIILIIFVSACKHTCTITVCVNHDHDDD